MIPVKVDRDEPTDLFEQVAAEIRRAIAEGEAEPGERLPPAKDLAAVLGVNTNTVLRALRLLREEGLLEFRRGRGSRSPARQHRAPSSRRRGNSSHSRGVTGTASTNWSNSSTNSHDLVDATMTTFAPHRPSGRKVDEWDERYRDDRIDRSRVDAVANQLVVGPPIVEDGVIFEAQRRARRRRTAYLIAASALAIAAGAFAIRSMGSSCAHCFSSETARMVVLVYLARWKCPQGTAKRNGDVRLESDCGTGVRSERRAHILPKTVHH